MSLQDLKHQVTQLPTSDRLELITAIIQSLQSPPAVESWQYLVHRPHSWRQQMSIKGRKLLAATVWRDMLANQMTLEQAAENWDLPLAAVQEATHYCETHQALIQLEAEEERFRLQEKGVFLEPGSAA